MPTVADYAVLRDGSFELSTGEHEDMQPFFRPDAFVTGTNLARAIIAFKVRPLPTPPFAPNLNFRVLKLGVPDETIFSPVNLSVDTIHGLWETFPATGFGQNIGTEFRFQVDGGRGRFSDVVLWYQVDV